MNKALVALFIVFCLISCASNPTTAVSPDVGVGGGASDVAIQIARAAARVGITVTLQRAGVSAESSAAILQQLRVTADAVLSGRDVRAVLADPALWQPLRADLVSRLGAIIAQAEVSGVQLYDQATAEVIAGQLLDAFAAAVGRRQTAESVSPPRDRRSRLHSIPATS